MQIVHTKLTNALVIDMTQTVSGDHHITRHEELGAGKSGQQTADKL